MTENLTASLAGSSGKDSPNQRVGGPRLTGYLEHYVNTYSELLKDPRWQRVRLEKLQASEWACEVCYDKETMLSVHHKRYVKGRKPWEYAAHELVVLCQPCHEDEHEAKELRSELISRLHPDGPASVGDFFAVGAGYIAQATNDEGIAEVARQFESESPYSVAAGRFYGSLDLAAKITIGGFHFMTEALNAHDGNEFVRDLVAVFEKHGVVAKPYKGAA